MFKEGLSLNKFAAAMDENQVMKVADRRLIDYNEYSTQISSNDLDSQVHGSSGNGYNNGTMHWARKAEECITAVIRVGLYCTAQQPKDRWTMRVASTKLRGIKQSLLGL